MWVGGVRVVILDNKNRVLMVCQHHEDKDIWMVPGGGIEDGEDTLHAGIRELLEETGLEIEMGPLLWHVEEVSESRGQRFVNFFMGRLVGGDMRLGMDPEFDDSHQVLRDVKFMTKEELQAAEHVYPVYLKDELWDILDQGGPVHNAFKVRKSL
ncbi:MAG: NUDIX hydrolase [Firmicutes bacterium]|nr:NUDIX hydrolase [Bacillota bacterium]